MGRSSRDRHWIWISGKAMTLSGFFWDYIAPGFLIKIRDKVREWRLKRYKMLKVKASKMMQDLDYYMEFNIIIKDNDSPRSFGPFNISIPAKGAFFAKRKLYKHVVESVDVEVVYFDRGDDPHIVYHKDSDNSMFDVLLFDDDGELLETIDNVKAKTSREAYLKVVAYVQDHSGWDAVNHTTQ